MGKLRFYTCGKYGLSTLMSLSLVNTSGTSYRRLVSVNWKDTNGTTHDQLRPSQDSTIFGGFYYATAETEQTFNESNNTYTEISGVTFTAQYSGDTVNTADGKVFRTVSVRLKNTNETAVTVPSITSAQYYYYNGSSSAYGLSWVYIFDTPITLAAGEAKTVVFNFGYTLPTNDD